MIKQLDGYVLQMETANFIIREDTTQYRTNREFKDGIFRLLFSEREAALELFNALEGTSYNNKEQLEIVTLQDAIYNQQVNDLAFQFRTKILSLVEHQSTWSENMPLRELIYLARTYEKILDNKKAYQRKLYKIPTPHLFVLYNGEEDRPSETTQYLSEAFIQNEAFLWGQISVKIININYHKQHPILSHSRTLNEYAYFIEAVRENIKKEGMKRDESIHYAIRGCINKGILKSFLEKHGSEVENMFTLYITEEEFIDIRVEERAEELAEERAETRAAELAEVKAKELAEVKAKELAEVKARELAEVRARELAEARAAQIAEETERSIVRNIAQNGIIPTQIVELTGLSETIVKRYLD